MTKILNKLLGNIPETALASSVVTKLNSGNSGLKYLTATDVGLVSTVSSEDSSPFTAQEYLDARNNGINLAAAIKQADAEGYSGIVLEKGNYPLTSNAGSSTDASGSNGYSSFIDGISDMTLDFNGATFYLLYDSLNRSPYDTTANPIYQLGVKMLVFQTCKNITIKNLELKGDNYMRSWVAGEENDIGCYGIAQQVDCQNFKIDNYTGHGFRCEPLAVSFKGYNDMTLPTWASGGIDASGNDIVEAGSYSTPFRALDGTIVDNSISIVGWGFTREIQWRDSLVKISYYESDDTFIMSEWTVQNKLNYLPDNAAKIRITAYGDERTDPTVSYNNCAVTSGTPRNLEVVHSKFYNNMRGGIAGAANNTIVRNCVFHTIGDVITTKFGWLAYTDTTQFGINVEDGMPDFLTIDGCRFENTVHAFLTPACQTLTYRNNISIDMEYDSSVLNCKVANITGNSFYGNDGVFGGLGVEQRLTFSERTAHISDNLFMHSNFSAYTVEGNNNNTIHVEGNKYIDSKVILEGNVISTNNYHNDYTRAFQSPIEAIDIIKFDDIVEEVLDLSDWEEYKINTRNNDSRAIINVRSNQMRIGIAGSLNIPSIHFKGEGSSRQISSPWDTGSVLEQSYNGTRFENLVVSLGDAIPIATLPDLTINYNDVDFIDSELRLNRRSTSDGGILTYNFNNCLFDFTNSPNLRLLNNTYSNVGGQVILNFNNCRFISETPKTIDIADNVAVVGLEINLTGCDTDNITLTFDVTPTLKFKNPNPNCPSYVDNATALAALGEGYSYKDTTSGTFEVTIT